ncbi:hypothetical protein DPMN_017278 [Dreissena polymorpha]|uniref:Uncharacterized protein n=1 Tax=Dreissena polymorpha TaxID=45954 RepID=A0A9D4NGC8_DREPO|nr:hypothetical protein DPMN_017278 [Dreissena polymorpha]
MSWFITLIIITQKQKSLQARTREQQQNTAPGGMEVSPEFLAALPPNIQEEVRDCFVLYN